MLLPRLDCFLLLWPWLCADWQRFSRSSSVAAFVRSRMLRALRKNNPTDARRGFGELGLRVFFCAMKMYPQVGQVWENIQLLTQPPTQAVDVEAQEAVPLLVVPQLVGEPLPLRPLPLPDSPRSCPVPPPIREYRIFANRRPRAFPPTKCRFANPRPGIGISTEEIRDATCSARRLSTMQKLGEFFLRNGGL